ncbi:hypothetical protein TRVL_02701 [Trypanosoma vivax]|nr:hypothetical protein TRVL_02701 [Trypanosoma vivax]
MILLSSVFNEVTTSAALPSTSTFFLQQQTPTHVCIVYAHGCNRASTFTPRPNSWAALQSNEGVDHGKEEFGQSAQTCTIQIMCILQVGDFGTGYVIQHLHQG